MTTFLRVLALTLLAFAGYGQELLGSRTMFYVSGFAGQANGMYRDKLTALQLPTSSGGFTVGYVKKPNNRPDFPLFLGGEFGVNGLGAGTATSYNGIDYRTGNTVLWLNGVLRYRPVYWTAKINPFVDLSAGPLLASTSIFEYYDSEYVKVDGRNKVIFNGTLGGGIGFKLPQKQRHIYLDVGVYLQQTGITKLIERNSVVVTADSEIVYRDMVTNLNNVQFRFGLTWY